MPGTFNFTGIRNTALGLLAKFGRDCVMLRDGAATADAATPWRVTAEAAPSEYPFVGPVVFDTPPSDGSGDQSDCTIYVPGNLAVEPTPADRIRVVGVVNGQTNPELSIRPSGVKRIDFGGNIMFVCRCTAWVGDTQGGAT